MILASLTKQFAYKAWANKALYAFLAAESKALGEHERTAVRMMNHMFVVNKIFAAHVKGFAHGYTFANTEATPLLAELSFEAAELDAWWCDFVAKQSEANLSQILDFTFTDGDPGKMSLGEILEHLILHGTYHRGNVGQLFKNVGLAPPRDLYTTFLHQSEPKRRVQH